MQNGHFIDSVKSNTEVKPHWNKIYPWMGKYMPTH